MLQCDIEQFFPSVDLAILRDILARKLADAQVMGLVDRILEGGAGVLRDEYEMVYFLLPSTGDRSGLPTRSGSEQAGARRGSR